MDFKTIGDETHGSAFWPTLYVFWVGSSLFLLPCDINNKLWTIPPFE